MNHELLDVQAEFRKGRGTRDKIVNIHLIIEKARKFQKKSTKYVVIIYNGEESEKNTCACVCVCVCVCV